MQTFQAKPETTILTFTNCAADQLNDNFVKTIFAAQTPLALLKLDNDTGQTPIYKGMRVMITQNRDKSRGVVNGQSAVVHAVQNTTVFLKLPTEKVVPVYPVTMFKDDVKMTFYPLRVAYALTICKCQGQTLPSCIVWFDIDNIPKGTGYVALSRVKKLSDIFFLTPLKRSFFKPVDLTT